MQERVTRFRMLFHVGLVVMLVTAALSASSDGVAVTSMLTALTLTGAATALLAKIRLLQLQRSLRRHAPRPGVWAIR
ncbi:MAG TPA: hypothetical protein PL151_10675 [Phycisphaerae bacterium]|nr:hypothetical protein [Phycisphaerae bacterium]HOJ72987.1 hypothetical protein [Phycisphaerae bacterium]HOM50171.1 hypothetical protein [Phycisphaerae bacterium]HON67333.1 hypothetical protein [Phycisphaerae bacterium]HOQ84310.1 hypothetical protein [Phycisphaerae bacterium]